MRDATGAPAPFDIDALAELLARKLKLLTPKILLTPREAAQALSISERFLRDLERGGQIKARRMNTSVRYDVKELERWAEQTRGTSVRVGESE